MNSEIIQIKLSSFEPSTCRGNVREHFQLWWFVVRVGTVQIQSVTQQCKCYCVYSNSFRRHASIHQRPRWRNFFHRLRCNSIFWDFHKKCLEQTRKFASARCRVGGDVYVGHISNICSSEIITFSNTSIWAMKQVRREHGDLCALPGERHREEDGREDTKFTSYLSIISDSNHYSVIYVYRAHKLQTSVKKICLKNRKYYARVSS